MEEKKSSLRPELRALWMLSKNRLATQYICFVSANMNRDKNQYGWAFLYEGLEVPEGHEDGKPLHKKMAVQSPQKSFIGYWWQEE